MDSINDVVHKELEEKKLPDIPENSSVITNQLLDYYKSTCIKYNMLKNEYDSWNERANTKLDNCWGYRD